MSISTMKLSVPQKHETHQASSSSSNGTNQQDQQQQQQQVPTAAAAAASVPLTKKRNHHPMQGLTIDTQKGGGMKKENSQSEDSSSEQSSFYSNSESDDEDNDDMEDQDKREQDQDQEHSSFGEYNVEAALTAWDQICDLTHDITSSLMARQASMLCERFRLQSKNGHSGPPVKKRKLSTSLRIPTNEADVAAAAPIAVHDSTGAVVSVVSDQSSSSSSSSSAAAGAALLPSSSVSGMTSSQKTQDNEEGGLPRNLYSHVDRIGRMSKLVMEIEYCQKELRKDMAMMHEDSM